MPYTSTHDLPDTVRKNLPHHAQEIYHKAFNSAWDQYDLPQERRGSDDREETAHKVAWAAVKNSYEKNDYDIWVRKSKKRTERTS